MPSIVREVPTLGTVTTTVTYCDETVAQFRGIPYAAVEQRFQQPKICDSWKHGAFEASKFGPTCPCPPSPFNLVGASLDVTEADMPAPADEFKCLNLNITTPASKRTELLPVVVYFHGGSNCVSSGSAAGYNAGSLVGLSIRHGNPVIVVTINYRLGAFGFMASEDIKADNEANGFKGVGNYGIYDQYTALKWIKQYITGFGGDPDRITAWGESSGASDLHILMMSPLVRNEALFSQAVVLSGNAVMGTRELQHQQHIYDKFLEKLQISSSLPPDERLKKLRASPPNDVISAYACLGSPMPNWQATVDGVVLETLPTCKDLAKTVYATSINRILVGDCEQEGIFWAGRIKQKQWTELEVVEDVLRKHFDGAEVDEVAGAYNLTGREPEQPLIPKLIKLCSEAEFRQPLYELLCNWKGKEAFYYHMRFVNHFEGLFKGSAHHGVDLLFFFQTYNHLLSPEYAAAAEEMGKHFIDFFCGISPWTSFNKTKTFMAYGPESVVLIEQQKDDFGQHQDFVKCKGWQDKLTLASRDIRNEIIYKK